MWSIWTTLVKIYRMAVDLTKLAFHSSYSAFKNEGLVTGSFTISGTTSGGVNTRTETVDLGRSPDLADVIFSGRSSALNDRPNDAWFKNVGPVYVLGDNVSEGFEDFETIWFITYKIDDSDLIITSYFPQQFTASLTLQAETINYRVVDYSVF